MATGVKMLRFITSYREATSPGVQKLWLEGATAGYPVRLGKNVGAIVGLNIVFAIVIYTSVSSSPIAAGLGGLVVAAVVVESAIVVSRRAGFEPRPRQVVVSLNEERVIVAQGGVFAEPHVVQDLPASSVTWASIRAIRSAWVFPWRVFAPFRGPPVSIVLGGADGPLISLDGLSETELARSACTEAGLEVLPEAATAWRPPVRPEPGSG